MFVFPALLIELVQQMKKFSVHRKRKWVHTVQNYYNKNNHN